MQLRCTSPRTVAFKNDGKTISWSSKEFSKEYAPFQLPCGKCIECRLDYARQWAIRCVHEAQMHERNCFVTLTYSDENLKSTKLVYSDFQKFMKKIRKLQNDPIGVFVTGEYGDQTKRPHWHAILFNWAPLDSLPKYKTDRGDQVWESETLSKIWGHGIAEYGSVTFESAGYCARYAAKKLVHGKDDEHEYQPISKKSSKNAIGKKWLEQHWPDIFNYGQVVLPDGRAIGAIPRYYERWLKQHHPEEHHRYITNTKANIADSAISSITQHYKEERETNYKRSQQGKVTHIPTRNQVRKFMSKKNLQILHDYLKLK